MNKKVVITSAARTPIGAFMGGLRTVPAETLAGTAINEALKRSGIEDRSIVDDVILGHVESSGEAPNIARIAALLAGGMEHVPGYTVNRICGSGIQAVANAYLQIRTGIDEIVVGGGVENMSRAPYYLPLEARYQGLKIGDKSLLDTNSTIQRNTAPYSTWRIKHMGHTAEKIIRQYEISRNDSDRFAYDSQMKCQNAMERGRFMREIVPVQVPVNKGEVMTVNNDEHPKPQTTMEGLEKLKSVFEEDGTVTAGNASGLNDGAAALVLMSLDKAEALGQKPMVEIVDFTVSGLDPTVMGLGPVYSIQKLLKKVNMNMEDIDVYEINEAFAGQVCACLKALGMYFDTKLYQRVNPNGGAVALGHPLGCTGGRLLTTAAFELLEKGKEYAIVSACIGGGMGIAMLIKNRT